MAIKKGEEPPAVLLPTTPPATRGTILTPN